METQKPLLKDEDGEEVDVHLYRSMIGSLMYLTSSRPDIIFAVCACARYQVNPKVSHLHAVKRIFRYLKGQPKLGLWYPKDSPFDLVAYTDSDYAGASLDRKSTTGGCQFFGFRLISWQCKKQTMVANSTTEAEYVVASSCCGQICLQKHLMEGCLDWNGKAAKDEFRLQALVDGKKIIITESTIRRDLQLEDAEGNDSLPNAAIFEQLTLMGDNVAEEAINEENVPTHSNDPLLSGEDRLKLEELMALYTNLQNRVLDLEHTKTTQALEIDSLKRRVKKLKKKQRSRTHGLRRLYKAGLSARVISSKDEGLGEEDAPKQGRKIHDIDADEDITLENDMTEKEISTADLVATVSEVVTTANVEVSTASPIAATIATVELTLAQTLAELKSARPKTKGVVMQEPSETTTTATTTTIPSKDKGKGIMVEEPLKMKKKYQVLFDEQEAIRIQAQFDEEERITREKEEANAALIAQ
ncbi:hypothetical protein Tco_0475454 [Tanacetum coccineum]